MLTAHKPADVNTARRIVADAMAAKVEMADMPQYAAKPIQWYVWDTFGTWRGEKARNLMHAQRIQSYLCEAGFAM